MPEEDRRKYHPSGEQIAGGVLAGQAEWVKQAGKPMLAKAPKLGRFVANRIPGLPGLVFDAASYTKAKDKDRAAAELIGQLAGGAVGSLAGPLGVAAGSIAGEKLAEVAYDNREDIKAWMDRRRNDVRRAAAERILPYTPIPRLQRIIEQR